MLFALLSLVCGILEWILRVDVFGYVFSSIGRFTMIGLAIVYCLLVSICTVFSDDEDGRMDKPSTAWGWLKVAGVILVFTALWFGSCAGEALRR